MKCECTCPAEGTNGRCGRDKTLHLADLVEHRTAMWVLRVSEEVPISYQVAQCREEVGQGQQGDDLLCYIADSLQNKVSKEYQD